MPPCSDSAGQGAPVVSPMLPALAATAQMISSRTGLAASDGRHLPGLRRHDDHWRLDRPPGAGGVDADGGVSVVAAGLRPRAAHPAYDAGSAGRRIWYMLLVPSNNDRSRPMAANEIDEAALTKGQRRKLHALRKSVGEEIADRAFHEWLASRPAAAGSAPDRNATLIVDTLWPLVQQGTLAIPRGGYLIRRGRGRIIVEPSRR